mgnify:CR=1 FL=1
MDMNIFLYAIIFIIGTVFGSFYTLAVYRIPKNIDIIKKHSYCPNCNNKLGFFELIPVLSYIFLGGKCKHCKEKIRPRYLILEILSGFSFVMLAQYLDINIYTLNIYSIINYFFAILYFTAIILIVGIDKEYRKIDRRVLAYGIIISIIYMIYLYTIETTSIYRYAIYLAIYFVLLIIDTFLLRRYAKDSYIVSILMLLNMILIFTGLEKFILTIILTLMSVLIYSVLRKILRKNIGITEFKIEEIQLGFYIGACNIFVIFIANFMLNYYFI